METQKKKHSLFLYLIWSYLFIFFIRFHLVSWFLTSLLPNEPVCTQSKLAHLNSCDHNNCHQMRCNRKWRQRPCSWRGVSPPGRNKLTCDMFPCLRCHHTVPHIAGAWPTHSRGKCSLGPLVQIGCRAHSELFQVDIELSLITTSVIVVWMDNGINGNKNKKSGAPRNYISTTKKESIVM